MKAVSSLSLIVLLLCSTAKGELLYSNATTEPPTLVSLILGDGQLAGVRFQLSSNTIIDGLGGNLQVLSTVGNESIFGALVALTGQSDYPDSLNLSTPDVLTKIVFNASSDISDVMVGITPLMVPPGDYAVIFGSDLFAATGQGAMSTGNLNFADSSTFYCNIYGGNWEDFGPNSGLRFTVYGVPVPEPSSALLLAFLLLVFALGQRSGIGLVPILKCKKTSTRLYSFPFRPRSVPAEIGEQLVQFIGQGLHLRLRGRIGHRQVQIIHRQHRPGRIRLHLRRVRLGIQQLLQAAELRPQFRRRDRRIVRRQRWIVSHKMS